jgi:DNA-binding protein HU-beta
MPVTTAKKATAKKAAPAKSAVQATITLKYLAAELADSHDIAKKQAEAVLGDLVTLTTRHLKKGAKIRLTGLGILQVRKRAARMGRNPATGETIKIKASKKVAFRPARGGGVASPVNTPRRSSGPTNSRRTPVGVRVLSAGDAGGLSEHCEGGEACT